MKKFVLNMMAFVFAIGVSFAFNSATGEEFYQTGHVNIEGNWYEVDVNCQTGAQPAFECNIELADNPTVTYPVYSSAEDTSEILKSTNPEAFTVEMKDLRD